MEYQVWTKVEYADEWQKVDCGDKESAMREIDTAVRAGKDPFLTIAVPYKLSIRLEEDKAGEGLKPRTEKKEPGDKDKKEVSHEVAPSEARGDKGSGAES